MQGRPARNARLSSSCLNKAAASLLRLLAILVCSAADELSRSSEEVDREGWVGGGQRVSYWSSVLEDVATRAALRCVVAVMGLFRSPALCSGVPMGTCMGVLGQAIDTRRDQYRGYADGVLLT